MRTGDQMHSGRQGGGAASDKIWEMKDQMFSVEHMYRFVKDFAGRAQFPQTQAALPYAFDN